MTDKHFRDWESHYMGYGYGNGEEAILPAIKRFFALLEDSHRYDYRVLEQEFGPLATWLMINLFAHADLIEYGTSPRFAWLTEKGKILRDYVATKTADELVDICCPDECGFYCFPDKCQCERPCNNPLFPKGATK